MKKLSKKQKKNIWIFGGILLALVILIVVISNSKKKNRNKSQDDGAGGSVTPGQSENLETVAPVYKVYNAWQDNAEQISLYKSLPAGQWPVKYGDKSKLVLMLQYALNKNNRANIAEDGQFGNQTATALNNAHGVNEVDRFLGAKILADVF